MAGAVRKAWCSGAVASLLVVAHPAVAQVPPPEELAEMSLEELGTIEVTSVSRRAQRLSDAAAAVYVITADDIRRAGVDSLPEALRLAPNLEVARVGASSYAISARGFNNAIGNKLQVLLDGRILYNPLFSGMFWDVPDTPLEDVERIEVISGPGSTLWGANAVNGVINILTRSAQDTRGGLVAAQAGTDARTLVLRYGGGSDARSVRVYAKAVTRDASERTDGSAVRDAWRRGQVGVRADWRGEADDVSVQGEAFRGRADSAFPDDLRTSGEHLLAEWTHRRTGGDRVRVQAYLDHRDRDIPGSIRQRLSIYDLEFQHDLHRGRHDFTWGLSHRGARDRVDNTGLLAFLPEDRDLRWSSVFAQDELALRGDTLRLTGGLRLEHNSYTGTEVLPSLRLAYKPSVGSLWWAAATRAVRTPSRFDRDLFAPAQPPFLIAGGPDFRSEIANVYELGYRGQPTPRWSYSITVFHHDYSHLRSFERRADGSFVIGNQMLGHGQGLEAWGAWQATPRWRLSGGVWLLHQDLRLSDRSTDPSGVASAGNDPHHQWQLRSSLDLPHRLELDASLRRVGALAMPRVPAYTALDVRLGWRPNDRFELALTGRNLTGAHVEFGNVLNASEFGREMAVSATWRF
jgi:iron complex outermembrane receptor protein